MKKNNHLYERLSKGDEVAFSHFFSMYREKVYHFVLLVVKAPEIAEEATIDVFLKLWQKRSALPGVNDMDAFLFIVAKRKALDFLEKASKDKKIQKMISESWSEYSAASPNPHASMEHKELAEKVLSSLSPQRKAILMLSRVDGLSHKEISKQLNISQNTVKNTISQAIKSLESLKKKLWIETKRVGQQYCWLFRSHRGMGHLFFNLDSPVPHQHLWCKPTLEEKSETCQRTITIRYYRRLKIN